MKGCLSSRLAVDADRSSVALDDPVHHGETQSGTLAYSFRGEKRIEDARGGQVTSVDVAIRVLLGAVDPQCIMPPFEEVKFLISA
jgi:hypothetical protein